MGDVTGNHDAAGAGMVAPHQLQTLAGIEQYPQGDAAAIAQADRPAQVAGPPAFPPFRRQGRTLQVGIGALLTAMVDPAILKAEFQGPHIAGGDQLARFDAQIGGDQLHHGAGLLHLNAAGGTEAQVVGPKGGAG